MGGHGKAMGMPAASFPEQEILQPGQPTVGRGCPQPSQRSAGPAEAVEEDGPLGRPAEACTAGPTAGQLARLSDPARRLRRPPAGPPAGTRPRSIARTGGHDAIGIPIGRPASTTITNATLPNQLIGNRIVDSAPQKAARLRAWGLPRPVAGVPHRVREMAGIKSLPSRGRPPSQGSRVTLALPYLAMPWIGHSPLFSPALSQVAWLGKAAVPC
jgi:hypothetical protein